MADAIQIPGAVAREFESAQWGRPTAIKESRPTVGTTTGRLIENNPRRVFWLAINRSVNNGAIGFANDLTFANGILLGAAGGQVSMDVRADGESVGWEVMAINDAASGAWYVLEIVAL